MYSRQDIERIVRTEVKTEGLKHISDMLEEIQRYLIYNAVSPIYTSNFVKRCADESWDYAAGISDSMNREILTETTIFQEFVKSVKSLPEYISIKREIIINKLLDE